MCLCARVVAACVKARREYKTHDHVMLKHEGAKFRGLYYHRDVLSLLDLGMGVCFWFVCYDTYSFLVSECEACLTGHLQRSGV